MTYFNVKTRPYAGNFNHALQTILNPLAGADTNSVSALGTVPVNIYNGDTAYEIEVVAPGHAKEDFKLSIEKNLLTVSTEVKEEESSNRQSIRREYKPVSFKRSFTLDEHVDTDNIKAQYNNGVLHITLQKKASVTPATKQITIQ
jgi:HSP20 family protein